MGKYKKYSFVTAVALMLIFSSGKTSAIEYGMLGGKPANPDANVENSNSWFIYNLKPGEAKEDALEVMNLFEEPLEVLIYAADTTQSSSGGFALKQYSEPKTEVGSWVKFYPDSVPEDFADLFSQKEKKIIDFCATSRDDLEKYIKEKKLKEAKADDLEKWCAGVENVEVELESKEKLRIPFIFSVPEGADAGEHTGGILIQKKAAEDTLDSGGTNVKLTTRVGVRIYQTVPGEVIKKLTIANFSVLKNFSEFSFSDWFGEKKPKEYTVETVVNNEGNVSMEHENNLEIKNILYGSKVEKIERKFQVLKKDKFIANYSWQKPLFGYYAFTGEIKYKGADGDEVLKTDTVNLWVIPWREIGFSMLFLVLVGAAYYFWKKNRVKKYGGIGWDEYKVKKGETVLSLSEKFKVDWKVLIKTNKIKAPYLLEAGQVILVPPRQNKTASKKTMKAEIITEKIEKEELKKSGKPKKKMQDIEKKDDFLTKFAKKNTSRPDIVIENKPWNKYWIYGGAILAVIIIAIFSWIFFKPEKSEPAQSAASPAVEKAVSEPDEKEPEPEKEIGMGDLGIKVLNEGAPAGLAGKVKTALISGGYARAEAGNGKSKVSGNFIYYSEEKFKKHAEEIRDFLKAKNVVAEILEAKTEEQKSGDIVIILGE
ncbi:MAG TPA: hypothetical protein DIT25_03040 [Candidatus Moranbacteria bacterium]|nr:hypothetical protein [Candidatus Moranbacteria bacterium]